MTMIAARISSARGHYNAPVNQICGTTGQAGRLAGPRLQIDDGAAIKAVGRTVEGSRVACRVRNVRSRVSHATCGTDRIRIGLPYEFTYQKGVWVDGTSTKRGERALIRGVKPVPSSLFRPRLSRYQNAY